ncbi:SAM-dependent methyltransferase [Methanopyrus kandleri]|uniref:Precorrin-6B methylase n=2 Tax=Methanopyrus kandleri TaxID=2320 RepID=Q8TVG1_METKA|nr:SAM-dependent methyltransferase [Methanopyrus kandleri]AAM02641.1 Precorrin-6B methylase [Methanopyrus kandleri AV19]HII70240.1 cobalt-precorrin-7 (C(5))-methyltransferase [Methanopyrus kandleri]
MQVVGVGPNPTRFLTIEAIERIARADLLISSESILREIDGLRVEAEIDLSDKEVVTWNGSVRETLTEYADSDPVVVARGDPTYMGVGRLASLLFDDVEIVPGVSSLQALTARFGRGFHEVEAHVNLHSEEDVEKVVESLGAGRTTAVLFGKVRPAKVVETIESVGLNVKVIAGERLWYPDERLATELHSLRNFSEFTVAIFEPDHVIETSLR